MRKIFCSVVLVLALYGTAGAGVIIVNTPADLDNVRNNLTADYKLGGDIDLTAYISSGSGNSSATDGWLPIGVPGLATTCFTGSFDGDGHVIKGLWVNRPDTLYIGLFGYTQNATISNLGIEIDNGKGGVVGNQSAGGLVGCQASDSGGSSVIEYCYVSGDVTVASYCAGGLVGMQSNSAYGGSGSITIKNCYATGDVKATNSFGHSVGGLVGGQDSSSLGSSSVIENCYATGNVSAPSRAGGLVGRQDIHSGNSGAIVNCYATGNATATTNYAGGLVGEQNAEVGTSSTIENCFAFGAVESPGAGAYALVGAQSGAGTKTIASSYRHENVKVNGAAVHVTDPYSAPDKLHGGVKTIGELMTKTTYTGNQWLFNDSIPTAGPWYWDSTSFPKLNMGTEIFPFPREITITSQPQDASFAFGNISGNLSVSASVVPPGALSYQWYSNTTDSNFGGTPIPGATNAGYPIPASLTAGNHYYYCVISAANADSVSSDVAVVTVIVPFITIYNQPQDALFTFGNISGNLSVSASVTPSGTLSYQWHSNTTNSNSGGSSIPGATNAAFTIPASLTVGVHYYYCVVSSTGAAPVSSSAVAVTVSTPVITITTQPQDAAFIVGNISGNLSVSASVAPPGTLSYQWYSNTTNSNSGGTSIPGATNASFPIPASLAVGAHYYYCEISSSGAASVSSFAATVTVSSVYVAVTGVTLNKSTLTLYTGASETLTATVAPADATDKNVTWSTSDAAIASVNSSGSVTANSAGIAVITATTDDGNFSAECLVTVSKEISGETPLPGGGTGEFPVGTILGPDGTITLPDGEGGTVTLADGTIIDIPGGSVIMSDGLIVLPDGEGGVATTNDGVYVELPEDTVIMPDGTVILPDGKPAVVTNSDGDVKTEVTGGIKIEPDGTVTLTGNATVTTSDGTKITLPSGSFYSGDTIVIGDGGAKIISPGGSVKTIPEGAEIKINPDGSVKETDTGKGGGGCNGFGLGFLALVFAVPFVLKRR